MQNKTKIKIFVAAIILALLAILANYILSEVITISGNQIKRVYVRDVMVKAEVVKTETRIEKGLAGRASLPAGRGMLFEMPDQDTQHFWMKDMRFAIDIIWIENNRVIGCEKNISPGDPRIFTSPGDARYVLEVPEGFCDQDKVMVNDEVKI
ncbi:MAG: DUF192 domain-containing protein [Candidatus Moranbacteria bacterium]|nr:DUF192 domain-containing protein [Candidatus Moranbacteria bacterium]